jgi:hypothetical protein
LVYEKQDFRTEHKRQQLDWCRIREHWDIESNTIVFSDESRFCLGHHDVRQRIRRRRVEWRNLEFSVVRHVARNEDIIGLFHQQFLTVRGRQEHAQYVFCVPSKTRTNS